MAFTIIEDWKARGLTLADNGDITGNRVWFITKDNSGDDPTEAEVLAECPVQQYDPHPAEPRAIARTVSAKPHESPRHYLVEVGYSSAPMSAERAGGADYPTDELSATSPVQPTPSGGAGGDNNSTPAPDRSPRVKFKGTRRTISADTDAAGTPYLNTAGDKIEGIERTQFDLVFSLKFWSLKFRTQTILDYYGRVNSAAIFGFPAKTLLVAELGYEPKYDLIAPGVYGLVREVEAELIYRPEGWRRKVLNAGRRQKAYDETLGGGAFKMLAILDDGGNPVADPVPLNEDGSKWTGGAFHYLEFLDYPEVSLTGLVQ